jgi:beta-glucosidase
MHAATIKTKTSHRSRLTLALLALTCTSLHAEPSAPETADEARALFRDPSACIDSRVNDLISRLTVDEKIGQLMMASPAIPRLGIPSYDWWNEALHGVARNGIATVFPQAIGLAASWNPELHQRIADVISTEARAKNNEALAKSGGASARYQGLTIWSPNINIFRDPRWGRGHETYGEDPFLTSRMAVAFVRGLQGDDPNYLKSVATVKHYAVHSGPEPLRHEFDAVVSNRDLRETYLPAFEAGIREGGAQSLMSAYNAVNGIPAPASKMLLQDILRGEWGFPGAVVGDVDNVSDMWREGGHRYVPNAAEASALAIKAGNDLCSGTTYRALPESLKRGLVTEAELDTALRRLLKLRFKLGQFDPADRVPYRKIPITENDSPPHDQLALEAARQSLVLLKNDGSLPWDVSQVKKVAILGPTSTEEAAMLGNYNGEPSRKVTLADGLKAKFESIGATVVVEHGVPLVKGYRENGQPFPAGILFADADLRTRGLTGEVFDNKDLKGKPIASRTDEQLNLQWDETQPLEGVPISNASVRWSGVLVPKTTGEHILSLTVEGAARLFIDDHAVIPAWADGPQRTMSKALQMEAGRAYKIRLEFGQTRRKAQVDFGWRPPGEDDQWDRALAAAKAADHIVLTLGLTPDLEGEALNVSAAGFKGGDRTTVLLPEIQRDLLAAVSGLKKPTVVVLAAGSAVSFDPDQANAVLLCWYYGQRGADAVGEALIGETNPAGRLPVTFYKNDSDLPPFEDYSMANRTYRYFPGDPLFAFGHGLSYTTFDYQKVTLSSPSANATDTITLTATVKNSGQRAGDEVVQVYAMAENPPVPMPLKQLVGFKRVSLQPGETRTVEISLPVAQLRRWDEQNNRYVVDAGKYEIAVGPASDQFALRTTLTVVSSN